MTNPSPECDHPVTEKGGLDRICDECGAPIRDHMIGGSAPYHPRPIRSAPEPAPQVREALEQEIEKWDTDERVTYPDHEVLESLDRILDALTAERPVAQVREALANRLGKVAGRTSLERDREIIIEACNALRALTPVVAREPVQANTEQVHGQGDHLSTEKAGTIPWKDDKRQFPLCELAPDFTLFDRDPQADERLKLYRDIFAEITAKAAPVCDPTSDDPERVRYYRLPVGPLHRAAGKLGFQLFNGEQHLANAVAEIARLKAAPPAGQVIANQNDLRGSQPETVAREPIGWRVRVRQGDATYHLYTEALPFEPWTGSPITVLSEPEPLYTSPPPASAVREALEEAADIALAIDSGRGNEKEIAKAIRALASKGTADESTKTIG